MNNPLRGTDKNLVAMLVFQPLVVGPYLGGNNYVIDALLEVRYSEAFQVEQSIPDPASH